MKRSLSFYTLAVINLRDLQSYPAILWWRTLLVKKAKNLIKGFGNSVTLLMASPVSTWFLIAPKDDNTFLRHGFLPQKLCLWFTNFFLFITSFFSTQKSDSAVCNSLAPQGPFIKVGVMFSSLCLLDNKAGVSNSVSIYVAFFWKHWVY